jgi:hypothetical protein
MLARSLRDIYIRVVLTLLFRVINWNISYMGNVSEKADCLFSIMNEVNYPYVIALQEVTER